MMEVWMNSAWNTCWIFAAEELPYDGTLMLKHVRVDTWNCVLSFN